MAAEHGFVFCATRWIGMAREDVPNVAGVLADVGRFRTIADLIAYGYRLRVPFAPAFTLGNVVVLKRHEPLPPACWPTRTGTPRSTPGASAR